MKALQLTQHDHSHLPVAKQAVKHFSEGVSHVGNKYLLDDDPPLDQYSIVLKQGFPGAILSLSCANFITSLIE